MRFALHHMRRQLAADPLAILALALVVTLASLLTTSVLRLLNDAETRQGQYDLGAASVWKREPSAKIVPAWPLLRPPLNEEGIPGDSDFGPLFQSMRDVREDLPEPFRSFLVDEWAVTEYKTGVPMPEEDMEIRLQTMVLRTDPRFAEVAEIVAGDWPQSRPEEWGPEVIGHGPGDFARRIEAPIDVIVHVEAAELLGWEVGEEFSGFRLTGTYRPTDPQDPYWAHVSVAAEPHYRVDMDRGAMIDYSLYLHPSWGAMVPDFKFEGSINPSASTAVLWYTMDTSPLRSGQMGLLAAQSRAFSNQLSVLTNGGYETQTRFVSATADVLEGSVERIEVVRSVLAIVAVGPLAILLAVLALGVRLIVDRRSTATAQLAARGASTAQIALPAVAEGLLVAILAAGAGIALACLVTPGRLTVTHASPALILGLAPAVMLAASTRGVARGATGRADLGGRSGRSRVLVEIVILLLAALSLGSLFAGTSALGQLVAPIGATAAALVVALRIYPSTVSRAERRAARGTGATSFVGFARARRSPSGGLVPVIALVAGVNAALLSTVLWSTVDAGSQATVWQQVGAPVRASGPIIEPAELEKVEGIERVAGIATIGTVGLGSGRAQLIAVDAAALNEIQRDARGIDHVMLDAGTDGAIPLLATAGTGLAVGESTTLAGLPAVVTGTIERLGGMSLYEAAAVVDRQAWSEASGTPAWARVALIEGDEAAARQALPNALVETPASTGTDFLASPLGRAMRLSLVAGLAVAAALIALTVSLMQLLDAPARRRDTAVLRTMGALPREVRATTAASMLPTVLLALATGLLAGLGLPWLLTASADLRPLTGSEFQPVPVYDPLLLGAAIVGIVGVLALAVWWAAHRAGKASLARELRSVER